MKRPTILIVDADRGEAEKNASLLRQARYNVLTASGCKAASDIIDKRGGRLVVLCGLEIGGECGLAFLKETLRRHPSLPFTFLASSPPLHSVIEALKQGAYDFLRKPVSAEILSHSVARSAQRLELTLEAERQDKEIRKLLAQSRKDLQTAQNLSSFKGFMMSMAAHDFRSIVGVLDGYLQFLNERCGGCEVIKPRGVLLQARRTIHRLRSMTETILDFEAAENGTMRVDIRPFALAEVLEECVSFYGPYAEQKRINLRLAEDIPDVSVHGDRSKVMQVLDNLLHNALKFTPSQGMIVVSGRAENGSATICVRDSGPGIAKERLKNIFVHDSMTAGTDSQARQGLGLIICKRLIEAQKGAIRITGAPGQGVEVSFSLPLQLSVKK